MSIEHPEAFRAPSAEAIAAYRRIATGDRAVAIKAAWAALVVWLSHGIALRYSDDAVTHPAVGKPCGC